MVVSRVFIIHRAVWAVIWVIGIGVMVRFFFNITIRHDYLRWAGVGWCIPGSWIYINTNLLDVGNLILGI